MNRSLPLLVALGWALGLSSAVAATDDARLVYRIGGAAPVSANPGTRTSTLTIGASVDWQLAGACGKFDLKNAINAQFDAYIRGQGDIFQHMVEDSISNLIDGIISLPFYLLQQTSPGKYQLVQSGMLKAEKAVQISSRSCQQIQQTLARGGNPFSDWLTVAEGQEWNRQYNPSVGQDDIVEAEEKVRSQATSSGISWVGGQRRGGSGQRPLRPVSDAAEAGYNIMLGRSVNASDPPNGAAAQSPLAQTFSNPSAVSTWLRDVIGDQEISLGSAPSGTPGLGLLPKVDSERDTIQQTLQTLAQPGSTAPTAEQLKSVSAPEVPISGELIAALRRKPVASRNLLLDRLASEVATARVVNRAMVARQVLQAGRGEPNIAAAGPAQKYLNQRALPALDADIEEMLLQLRVRRELVSDSALQILADDVANPDPTSPAPILYQRDLDQTQE